MASFSAFSFALSPTLISYAHGLLNTFWVLLIKISFPERWLIVYIRMSTNDNE